MIRSSCNRHFPCMYSFITQPNDSTDGDTRRCKPFGDGHSTCDLFVPENAPQSTNQDFGLNDRVAHTLTKIGHRHDTTKHGNGQENTSREAWDIELMKVPLRHGIIGLFGIQAKAEIRIFLGNGHPSNKPKCPDHAVGKKGPRREAQHIGSSTKSLLFGVMNGNQGRSCQNTIHDCSQDT